MHVISGGKKQIRLAGGAALVSGGPIAWKQGENLGSRNACAARYFSSASFYV